MIYRTQQEIEQAITETEVQEQLFRLAGDPGQCAYWVLERVKLRAQLIELICGAQS